MSAAEQEWLAGATPARNVGGRPAKGHTGRQRKLECQLCGFIAYASAASILRAPERPSCCGEPLTLPNLRDRVAIGDPDAIAQVEAEEAADIGRAVEADARRAAREQDHGFKTGVANCGVCGRFKRRPADRCDHCGDEPAQYGATDAERREAERIYNRAYGYAA